MKGCKTARYVGVRFPDGKIRVIVEDKKQATDLPMRYDIVTHSPDGPGWGHLNSRASQLALALCIHAGGKSGQLVYHFVKEKLIAPIKGDSWVMYADRIRQTMATCLRQDRPALRKKSSVSIKNV